MILLRVDPDTTTVPQASAPEFVMTGLAQKNRHSEINLRLMALRRQENKFYCPVVAPSHAPQIRRTGHVFLLSGKVSSEQQNTNAIGQPKLGFEIGPTDKVTQQESSFELLSSQDSARDLLTSLSDFSSSE